MKLNYDCVRDMLLALEELLTINEDLCHEYVPIDKLFEVLNKYDRKEVLYTFLKLGEAGYICIERRFYFGGEVHALTYHGHEFIESVRDNEMWESVKSILSSVGAISLPLILETAKGLAINALAGVIKISE